MKNHLPRQVGFEGTPKFGPELEVTTSHLQVKYGVEIGTEYVNKDNSHSWVRISLGLNKLVTDLSNNKENDTNEQETSEMLFEDFASKTNVLAFLRADQRLKRNQKNVLLPAQPQKLYLSRKESGLILSQKIIRPSLTQCQNN